MKNFDENLLLRKIQGITTPEEEQQVEKWLAVSEENRKNYAYIKMLWNARKVEEYSSGPDLERSLSEINRRIDRLHSGQPVLGIRKMLKYAAVFLGIVGLSVLIWQFRHATSEEPMISKVAPVKGAVEMVLLPDGTKVWLNHGARLTWPETFQKKSRCVKLEGEAYFEVTKDPSRHFFVKTPLLTTEVLGTSFNINTKAGGNTTQAVLVEGSIALLSPSGKRIAKLEPGHMASASSLSSGIEITEVNTDVYTAWQQGKVVFEKAGLTEILDKLEEVYNVRFRYDPDLMRKNKARYNFVFRINQDFDTVFSMLKFVAPLETLKVKPINANNTANSKSSR